MDISVEQIVAATGAKEATVDRHFDGIIEALRENSINTPLRVSHFLAQCAHESQLFERTTENLNYSWQALRQHFKKYFKSDEEAQPYHRQPRKIAARIYALRMGNGDEESQDGWFHRGAGIIQLTGYNNQRAYWDARGGGAPFDREGIVEILSAPPHAARSAGWYWTVNNLNQYADEDNLLAISGVVNVGRANVTPEQVFHYAEREKLAGELKEVFA